MNFNIHRPLSLTRHSLSNLVDMQVIQEPLLTIFSVMSSQKSLFVVILQLPFLTIYPVLDLTKQLLLIHYSINLMFLKDTCQNLTTKILSWTTLI